MEVVLFYSKISDPWLCSTFSILDNLSALVTTRILRFSLGAKIIRAST
jgi:hypothetical protein